MPSVTGWWRRSSDKQATANIRPSSHGSRRKRDSAGNGADAGCATLWRADPDIHRSRLGRSHQGQRVSHGSFQCWIRADTTTLKHRGDQRVKVSVVSEARLLQEYLLGDASRLPCCSSRAPAPSSASCRRRRAPDPSAGRAQSARRSGRRPRCRSRRRPRPRVGSAGGGARSHGRSLSRGRGSGASIHDRGEIS